jgi:FkbM family methyltransferase
VNSRLLGLPRRVARRAYRALAPAPRSRITLREQDGFTMAFRSHTTDEDVLRDSFSNDHYLLAMPGCELDRTATVIDVGAHLGGFAVYAASKAGRVFAIEASEETYNLLRVNAALNGCTNLTASRCALSDRRGIATLWHSQSGNWGHSLFRHGRNMGAETVSSLSLADYFLEHQIERCRLLKLNCEGAEFPILLGAPRDVLDRIDWIVALYHCDLAPDRSPDELVDRLRAHGMETHVILDKKNPGQRGRIIARRVKG